MKNRQVLNVNDQVMHGVFGEGTIESVDEDVVRIAFKDQLRTMSLKVMLKIKIIEKVGHSLL